MKLRTLEEIAKDIEIHTAEEHEAAWPTVDELYQELARYMSYNNDQWDDVNYSVKVDCPFHLTHKATLYTYGNRKAGAWACEAGNVGTCPHYDTKVEDTEEYEGSADKIYICALCLVAVEGDPIAEEAEHE